MVVWLAELDIYQGNIPVSYEPAHLFYIHTSTWRGGILVQNMVPVLLEGWFTRVGNIHLRVVTTTPHKSEHSN